MKRIMIENFRDEHGECGFCKKFSRHRASDKRKRDAKRQGSKPFEPRFRRWRDQDEVLTSKKKACGLLEHFEFRGCANYYLHL